MLDKILALRKEYRKEKLDEQHISDNPIQQFRFWFDESLKAEIVEPNAMMLATVNAQQRPSMRIVLLREILEEGIVFYTNYLSRKGNEIELNPFGSATFFWPELERQIRIEGVLRKIDEQVSDSYFAKRPRGSQIGAWSSSQSQPIESREALEAQEVATKLKFQNAFILTNLA